MKIADDSPRVEILGAVTKNGLLSGLARIVDGGAASDFSLWDAAQLERLAASIRNMLAGAVRDAATVQELYPADRLSHADDERIAPPRLPRSQAHTFRAAAPSEQSSEETQCKELHPVSLFDGQPCSVLVACVLKRGHARQHQSSEKFNLKWDAAAQQPIPEAVTPQDSVGEKGAEVREALSVDDALRLQSAAAPRDGQRSAKELQEEVEWLDKRSW